MVAQKLRPFEELTSSRIAIQNKTPFSSFRHIVDIKVFPDGSFDADTVTNAMPIFEEYFEWKRTQANLASRFSWKRTQITDTFKRGAVCVSRRWRNICLSVTVFLTLVYCRKIRNDLAVFLTSIIYPDESIQFYLQFRFFHIVVNFIYCPWDMFTFFLPFLPGLPYRYPEYLFWTILIWQYSCGLSDVTAKNIYFVTVTLYIFAQALSVYMSYRVRYLFFSVTIPLPWNTLEN